MAASTRIHRLGLIGGTGWPSTRDYYDLLNRRARERQDGLHGIPMLVWSFDLQSLLDDECGIGPAFADAACRLRDAGATVLAIASNTGHAWRNEVLSAGLPLVALDDACIAALRRADVDRIGVIATRRASGAGLFGAAFARAGLTVVLPPDDVADAIDAAIFGELETDRVGPLTHDALARAWAAFLAAGIRHVLLGCTELRASVVQSALGPDADRLTCWDSTDLHCDAIVTRTLEPLSTKALHAP